MADGKNYLNVADPYAVKLAKDLEESSVTPTTPRSASPNYLQLMQRPGVNMNILDAPVIPEGENLEHVTIPSAPSVPQQTELEKYWGQPIWKGGIPLDRFVQLTGMAAHAFAPDEPSGRLGRGLAEIATGANTERIRREYEGPNELLRQKYLRAQIANAEGPEKATEWEDFRDNWKAKVAAEGKPYDVIEAYKTFKQAGRVEPIKYFTKSIPNPDYNASKPMSATNAPQYKITIDQDGNRIPGVPPEAVIDPVAMAAAEEARKRAEFKLNERRTAAAEERARRSDSDQKGAWLRSQTPDGRLVRTNTKTDQVQIFKGDKWIDATEDEVRGITSLGRPDRKGKASERRGKGRDAAATGGPASRVEAFEKYKKRNPNVLDTEINAAITRDYPGLK